MSALALAVSPAMAAEIRFDGFASFVAGQVLDKDELVGDNFRGYDERLSFQNNSLFAIQARADLQDKLSATAQIIAKGSENYDANFNWAYLTYELSNNINIKAGRFRNPLFLYSDFLDVGYAYHWISPPDSVYNLSGFDSSDGVMLEFQNDLGNFTSVATLTAARTNADLEQGSLDSTNALTGTWTLSYDWFSFHVSYSESDITLDADAFNQIAEGLAGFGVSQDSIDDMLMESDKGYFAGIGISVDTGKFFAVAEYTEVGTDNAFPADPSERWYVSGGMRFGDWTAYATVENLKADVKEDTLNEILTQFDQGVAGLQFLMSTIPDPAPTNELAATYNQLAFALSAAPDLRNGVVALFNTSGRDEDIYSVGLRYNFHPSACAKVEYIEMDDKLNDVKPSAIAVAIDLVY